MTEMRAAPLESYAGLLAGCIEKLNPEERDEALDQLDRGVDEREVFDRLYKDTRYFRIVEALVNQAEQAKRYISRFFKKALSPLEVKANWDHCNLTLELQGHENIRWTLVYLKDNLSQAIEGIRGDLQGAGVSLDAWQNLPPPTRPK